jgi:dTDP-4-dehydrorhamnose reductase
MLRYQQRMELLSALARFPKICFRSISLSRRRFNVRKEQIRILLTGRTGQLGYELARSLTALGEVIAPSHGELDLENSKQIHALVTSVRPALIVNAAAYTAVDAAEANAERCFRINAEAPGILAREARTIGAVIIHFSTDYVFDGQASRPYVESDSVGPLSVYGASKLAGERAVADAGAAWMIFRSSWVYGNRGRNFMLTVARLAAERDCLRIVNDQYGTPNWSRTIAEVTAQVVAILSYSGDIRASAMDHTGLYHLTAGGVTTWHDFARAIIDTLPVLRERRNVNVEPIATVDYPTPAKRPRWSVLDNSKLNERFGIRTADWRRDLELAVG